MFYIRQFTKKSILIYDNPIYKENARKVIEVIRFLISEGVDFTYIDEGGYTLLHMAAFIYPEVLEFFLRLKTIDVNQTHNKHPFTALSFAAGYGNFNAVKLLLNNGASPIIGHPPLVELVSLLPLDRPKRNEFIDLLLNHSETNVNQQRADGETALFRACLVGDAVTINKLAERNADPNLPSKGIYPLQHAIKHGDDVIQALLSCKNKLMQPSSTMKKTCFNFVELGIGKKNFKH